ncbi:hypothetical protein BIT28_08740 [Photobacterium proteolyticum]|uniref:Type I restriction modification DNA specificity domain-containing protein n=1 Tax=Photobacterium proteolyticum TaxID=1903952 RepID=A0A1Q9GIG3_9GAMM|nr:restriction endonuclease subunit S [Photobacterium proteolyticum]OLQ74256.1 hypothetical protein BIT28_08740 [Photobacterium proteolyticum]
MSELPKGWLSIELKEICKFIDYRGKTPKKVSAGLPLITAKNIRDGYINREPREYVTEDSYEGWMTRGIPEFGDILITSEAPLGNVACIDIEEKFVLAQRAICLQISDKSVSKFVHYFMRSPLFQVLLLEQSTGTTVKGIKSAKLKEMKVCVAPLNEQIRIANKLDSILAKVDKAQARLDKIPAILKRFRQSVLAAATSGDLTDSSVTSKEWKSVKLIDVVETKPRNGKSPKGVDFDTGIKNLTLSAITPGYFVENKFKFVDLDVSENSHLWVKNQDILIQRANSIEYVGVSAIYEGEDDKYIYPDLIMKCRANDCILPKYLYYALSSEVVRKYFRDNATGTTGNMPKINQAVVSAAPISLPTLVEQEYIVGLVEKLFRKADKVEKQYLDAKARLDRLTQSILAKAFRGELVPQDPNDEPAEKLLERILAEKEQNKPKKVTRKRTTKAKTAEKV